MAGPTLEYEEVVEVPRRRLRAHSTPAVESPYTWLVEDDDQSDD